MTELKAKSPARVVFKPPTMVVHKYELEPTGEPGTLLEIELPIGATILRIGSQESKFQLWALIFRNMEETEKRKWLVVGTGHEFSAEALKDIAWISVQRGKTVPFEHQETVIALGGRLVFHFWISWPLAEEDDRDRAEG